MLSKDYLDTEVLSQEDAADLLLAAIVEGTLDVMDDAVTVELELMDTIAVKKAGGEHLVHWTAGMYYN